MKACAVTAVTALLILAPTVALHAAGYGVYGSCGFGPRAISIRDTTRNIDEKIGVGFVYDTALARNELHGYRLNVGYDSFVNYGSIPFGPWSIHQAIITNTFGMGIVQSRYARFWIGPQIEFACIFKEAGGKFRITNAYPFPQGAMALWKSVGRRFVIPMMGFGGAMGVNINAGKNFTIGIEAGMVTAMGLGPHSYTERSFMVFGMGLPTQTVLPLRSSHRTLYEYFRLDISAKLSIMYRVGDVYVEPEKENGAGARRKPDREYELSGMR